MTEPQFHLSRRIPVEQGYDLVVAGGGPGGCGAAIAAARLGAKVLLVESSGCLGGMGSVALVSAWSHMSDGQQTILGGLMLELVEAMAAKGYIHKRFDPSFWNSRHNRGLGFDPEGYKLLLDQWCEAAGVEVRFFTKVIDADFDAQAKRVDGFVLHNVEGYSLVRAPAFIDATGDAVVADAMGVPCFEAGRDTEHIMPPTLCSVHAGIDHSRFDRRKQQQHVERALDEGFFSQPDRHVPGLFPSGNATATLNAGHIFAMDALKCSSLSEGMKRGRQLAWEYGAFCRKYLPGCEDIELVATAALMGVRESRRVIGEYELDYNDYRARRQFPDQIAVYCKQVDIHVYDATPAEYERYKAEFDKDDVLRPGERYGIPYGVLVPKGWTNFWVAGRCNSSDVKVSAAIRDQRGCFMMGQAAGTAAVQAVRNDEAACALNVSELIQTLRAAGANLPQTELSQAMTRNPAEV